MNILITGGTGFIGKPLIHRLLSAGHFCHVVSRKSEQEVRALFSTGQSELTVWPRLESIPKTLKINAVINLAGEPIAEKRWTRQRKTLLRQSRIGLTTSLVEKLQELDHKPDVLISGSAVGYYGNTGDTICTENTPGHKEFTHELCAQWEEEAKQVKQLGIRCCRLRTGLVLGARGGFLSNLLPFFKLGLGAKLGSGEQWMSWIHLTDMIEIILFLLETPSCSGAYNATAPSPVTNKDFTQLLAKALGRRAFLTIPGFVLELALGEMAVLLTGGQRVVPQKLLNEGYAFQYSGLDAALRATLVE